MKKEKKKLPGVWWWMIGLLFLGLCVFFLAPACRFSALGIWGLDFVILCYWLLGRMGRRKPKDAKILRRILTVCLSLLLLAMAVTFGFIWSASRGTKDNECQYLLVLGAGVNGTEPSLSLRERLTAALDYLNEHPDTVCIVSGGQGGGEDITEAQCMYDWLTAHGVAPERILMEEQATSTAENLSYSLALLEAVGEKPSEIAVVSSEYHLFRAGLMAKRAGVTALGVPAHTGLWPLKVNYYFREIFGVWYFLAFGG